MDQKMDISFRTYSQNDKEECLSLFDENCPEYFSPNEREDYEDFLAATPKGYEVLVYDDEIVGVFGLFRESDIEAKLDWILLSQNRQGDGLGSLIMNRVISQATESSFQIITIATSHKAYKFFLKKGASIISEKQNGWGPGMHRIDMELKIGK